MSTGAPVTNYVTDGTDMIAEYDGSGVLLKRYAFNGGGSPLVAYDASGTRSWMMADERGSIIALAGDTAAMTAIDTYDEYGIPAAANQGTFQYAGMLWLSRPGLYAPTFRAYGAHVGNAGMHMTKTQIRIRILLSFVGALLLAIVASIFSQFYLGASEAVSYLILGLSVPVLYELLKLLLLGKAPRSSGEGT